MVSLALLLIGSAQGTLAQVTDLGTLPGGTWAGMWDINDFGVAVGTGDNRDGNLRPIGAPLRGPQAFQWFDLGTLGGETTDCCWSMCMEVANSGLIVGHTPAPDGSIRAFAWSKASGLVDLGTLEGHTQSVAGGVNKDGNLIVGFAGMWGDDALPVVWTPDKPGKSWTVHKLDTQGFEQVVDWAVWTVNNNGQIVGEGWDSAAEVNIPFLWNPVPGGNGWKIMKLETSADHPHAAARDINQAGEIVGYVWTPDWSAGLPALWKPVAPAGSDWRLTVLPTLSGLAQGWNPALGINDAGDIVGASNDADWNWLAARWSAKDPQFVQVLGFPGDWSVAVKVNNNGIAVGGYGIGDNPERAVAVKFR
jgi:uncharacterized membrane protein